MDFDSEKQRSATKAFLKRLSRGPINQQQARNFMNNYTDYRDERSYKNFLQFIRNEKQIPVKKKGSKFYRTDISQEA